MKKSLAIFIVSLLFAGQASAQNYHEHNYKYEPEKETPYYVEIDSLISGIEKVYGGKRGWSTYGQQIFAPVKGGDDQLRQMSQHIVDRIEQYPALQVLSERVDDGTQLRGRYIVKLRPSAPDTCAYVFLKYDRDLLVMKHIRNQPLSLPPSAAGTRKTAVATPAEDEETSLFQMLIKNFYGVAITVNKDVEAKLRLTDYNPQDKDNKRYKSIFDVPAPTTKCKIKDEYLRMTDKDAKRFNWFCEYMNLADKEAGSKYGVARIDNPMYPDTCAYHYLYHTYSNGLSELIGVTHETGKTYLIHVTNNAPGLKVSTWGKFHWMTEEEMEAWNEEHKREYLGIWVYDAKTKASLQSARITTLDDEGQVLDVIKPEPSQVLADKQVYRYLCVVNKREKYTVKVECDGYETGYGTVTMKEELPGQIDVYLKPLR